MFSAMGLAEIMKLSFEIEIGLSRCRINFEERAWEQEFQSYLDPLIWLGLRNLIPRKLQHLSGSCFRYFFTSFDCSINYSQSIWEIFQGKNSAIFILHTINRGMFMIKSLRKQLNVQTLSVYSQYNLQLMNKDDTQEISKY